MTYPKNASSSCRGATMRMSRRLRTSPTLLELIGFAHFC